MPEFLTLRIPGARRAARQSELHAEHRTPQHARPKNAGHVKQQRIEHARDAVSAGCATEDEIFALHIAVGTLA